MVLPYMGWGAVFLDGAGEIPPLNVLAVGGGGKQFTHLFLRCLTSFFFSRSRSCLALRITSEASSMELAGLLAKAGPAGDAPKE